MIRERRQVLLSIPEPRKEVRGVLKGGFPKQPPLQLDGLEGFLEPKLTVKVPLSNSKYIGSYPWLGLRIFVPTDKAGDTRLGDTAYSRPSDRRHVSIPRQGLVEPNQRRGG